MFFTSLKLKYKVFAQTTSYDWSELGLYDCVGIKVPTFLQLKKSLILFISQFLILRFLSKISQRESDF